MTKDQLIKEIEDQLYIVSFYVMSSKDNLSNGEYREALKDIEKTQNKINELLEKIRRV